MMKKIKCIASGLLLLSIGGWVNAAFAVDPCPGYNPIQLNSGAIVSGDTCAAGNPIINMGGIVDSTNQKDIVYFFIANGANASISIVKGGGAAGFSPVLMLVPVSNSQCLGIEVAPIAAGGAFFGPMTVTGLTNGQGYYVVVTSDPNGMNLADCGAFTMGVGGTLPVNLQRFSVE